MQSKPMAPWRRVEGVVIAGFAALYVLFVARASVQIDGQRGFTLFDDAMISMRYGRNLAAGQGLVFNAGEQVEGYTNLLWTLVMGAVHAVVPDPRFAPLVVAAIGALILVLQLLVTRLAVSRATDAPWAPTLAIAGVGASWALVFWTLRGMEVGLVGLLVTAALVVVHLDLGWSDRTRAVTVAALLAAAVFTRDDAVVLAAVVIISALFAAPPSRRVRLALGSGLALGALVVARVAVRFALYGDVVPNTYRLKVDGVPRELLLQRGLLAVGYALAFGTAVLVAVACTSWNSGRLPRTCLAVIGAQTAYGVLVGGDAWEDRGFASRFLATVTAPLVIAAVLGLVALIRGQASRASTATAGLVLASALGWTVLAPPTSRYFQLGNGGTSEQVVRATVLVVAGAALVATTRERWRSAGAVALAVLVVLAPNALPWLGWIRTDQPFNEAEQRWAQYGAALAAALPSDGTVAVASIGNIGYFSERPVVDLLGKIDPVVASTAPHTDFWALPGHLRWDYRHSVGVLRPDVVGQLFAADPADVDLIRAAGYREVAPMVFVRIGAEVVSPDALARAGSLAY